jgi:hypothetical protein
MDSFMEDAHTVLEREAALYRLIAFSALMLAGYAHAQSGVFDNLVQSRYVHCAFYKAYDVDPATGDRIMVEGRSQSLTHFQAIQDGRARQISTRAAGARNVRVLNGGKYLHFLDSAAGLYVLTTVYGCIAHDERDTCITYGAVQSRHFDTRVLADPDAVYEALKDSSDPGFCDHSFIGIQEAKVTRRQGAKINSGDTKDTKEGPELH